MHITLTIPRLILPKVMISNKGRELGSSVAITVRVKAEAKAKVDTVTMNAIGSKSTQAPEENWLCLIYRGKTNLFPVAPKRTIRHSSFREMIKILILSHCSKI